MKNDLISRSWLLDVFERFVPWDTEKDRNRATHHVRELAPSAQPEKRWIPCDETVEIPDHEVLACDKYGEEILGYLEYADDQWICESEGCVMYDPIAWMEKPEPYVEGRQDGQKSDDGI